MEESENYSIYSEAERNELLFAIFQLLVLGGSLNQYEDYLGPYRDSTRELYKMLVSVRKDASNDQMFIDTFAYELKAVDGKPVFEDDHPQNLLLVTVQPFTKTVNVLKNNWEYFN